jgi:hypothetical protein
MLSSSNRLLNGPERADWCSPVAGALASQSTRYVMLSVMRNPPSASCWKLLTLNRCMMGDDQFGAWNGVPNPSGPPFVTTDRCPSLVDPGLLPSHFRPRGASGG